MTDNVIPLMIGPRDRPKVPRWAQSGPHMNSTSSDAVLTARTTTQMTVQLLGRLFNYSILASTARLLVKLVGHLFLMISSK